MKLSLLLIMTFIVGCGPGFVPAKHYEVDPQLQPYVDIFIQEAATRGKHYTIDNLLMFFTDDYNVTQILGSCEYSITPIVRINRQFFANASAANKEQVAFHELGHCILNREHDTRTIIYAGVTIPKSIMSPSLFNEYYYITYRTYYLDELFGVP